MKCIVCNDREQRPGGKTCWECIGKVAPTGSGHEIPSWAVAAKKEWMKRRRERDARVREAKRERRSA